MSANHQLSLDGVNLVERESPANPLEKYYSPSWATCELLKTVRVSGILLEPCVGEGHISKVLQEHIPQLIVSDGFHREHRVITNDVDPLVQADFHLNAAKPSAWHDFGPIDFVVTNPPFSLAPTILPLAWDHAKIGVAMLLRGSYLEPCEDRQQWLKDHEDYLAYSTFLPRISFSRDGKTDLASCNWYVWMKFKVAGCKMRWVLK